MKRGRYCKKSLFSYLIAFLILIGFIWFVLAAAPDSPSLPNSPLDGANGTEVSPSPVLNVTVTDADSSVLNVSFYKNVTPWNIDDASYDSIFISTQDVSPGGLFFKSDGKKLYEIGEDGDKIYQYSCSDAWNLSSCSYDNINLSTQNQGPTGYGSEDLFFKSDGLKLYEIGDNYIGEHGPPTHRIYQYTCLDAWNLSSCSYDSVYISSQATYPQGLFFKSDGTKLYEIGGATNKIYQYTCLDAWNLSSCSYDSVYISTQDSGSQGLFFKSDGIKLYDIGGSDKIYQYTCSDAWNLSSCSYDSITLSTQDSSPQDLFFSSDGIKIYEVGEDGDKIYQYSISDYLLNKSTNVANNSYATYTWNDLSEGTTYKWFVNITDGTDTTRSSTWNFTTSYLPDVILNYPLDDQLFLSDTTSVILNITVTDADSAAMNVTFYNATDNILLCTNTSVSNNSVALCNWTGLSEGNHQWYANITDGVNTIQSSERNFIVLSSFCGSSISSDYTMTSSIYCNDTAVSFANNVTFNCDDNSVVFVGSDNYGKHAFSVSFVDNITIQNCNMKGFGIYAENATNLDILDNEIYNLSARYSNAIHIEKGENITIKNNLFNATDVAMDEDTHHLKHWKAILVNYYYLTEINSTRNLIIYNNTIIDHEWSMDIQGVTGLNVSRNKINITQLYRAQAITLRRVRDAILDRNVQYRTINDSWVIDSDGYVVDSGSRNITISNGRITNPNVHGIIMLDILGTEEYPQNVTIKNMTIINPVYSLARCISFYGTLPTKSVHTENSSVIGNDLSGCEYGIEVGGPYGGASNSRFINNTIHDIESYGVFDTNIQSNRADNLFENNVIYNTGGTGFFMSGSENSSFINNTVYDTGGHGISVDSNCNLTGNTIRNNTRGIYIDGDNNNISSNILEGNDYSIYLFNADNNSFYDMDASDSVLMDIYSSSSSSTNNYFTNVSHDKSDVSVLNSANVSFKWYLDAHATDIGGQDLANVTIIGLDKNNNQQFSNTTNENGSIQRQTVDEYYQTSLGRTYFTSYEISASKSGYETKHKTEGLTNNVFLEFSWLIEEEGGGNRGGSGACTTQWNCSEWGECVDNIQTRICSYPENWCEPREDKPVEFQTCVLDIDEKEENNIIEEKINEWNFAWLIVLLILVIAIVITKKIKETKDLRKSPQSKKGPSLVGWKI